MRTLTALTFAGLAFTATTLNAAPILGTAGYGLQTTHAAQENHSVYWDGNSWDSISGPDGGVFNPCNVGALATGGTCSLNPSVVSGLNRSGADHFIDRGNGGFQYWGSNSGGADANFAFGNTGGTWFEFNMLAEFTADWAVNEVGWYELGNPQNRHTIFDGMQNVGTSVTTYIEGNFGLYYRNTADPTEMFFTQSLFNTPGDRQQFAAFQADDYTILGVEDIFSNVLSTNGAIGTSDYDYNDVVFGFRQASVPEPGTLLLLGMGLVGAAARRFRRNP
jgi:hypothetical protein